MRYTHNIHVHVCMYACVRAPPHNESDLERVLALQQRSGAGAAVKTSISAGSAGLTCFFIELSLSLFACFWKSSPLP